MTGIHHQLAIAAPPSVVYRLLSSPEAIGTWWDPQTLVHTEDGEVLEHNPGERHGVVRLKIAAEIVDSRVEWECISVHPETSPASAWTGTRFIFAISGEESPASEIERLCREDDQAALTTLDFYQLGYDPHSRYFGFNNHAWGQVLDNLKRVCESRET